MEKLFKKFRHISPSIIDTLLNAEVMKMNDEGLLCISFLDQQKEEREERSKIRSKGGKASAEAKRLKKLELENNTKSTQIKHVLNSCSTQPQLLREEKRREEKKREDNINISFDDFWNLYNKKVGSKSKAETKWFKLKDLDRLKIMSTLPMFIKSIKDKQYQPHPITYLNNERWNDEVVVKKVSNQKIVF